MGDYKHNKTKIIYKRVSDENNRMYVSNSQGMKSPECILYISWHTT